LFVACRHYNIAPKLFLPKLTPEAVRVIKLMLPGMVGAGVMQINMLIDLQLASLLPVGAMSYLYYADRLYQLPMSIFGVAIGTALLPSLSKLWRANNRADALALQNKSLLFVLFMNMPAAAGLIVLSQPLIALLFGHGAFTAADVAQTAPTLAAYAIGLPAYVVTKVFTTTFFAQSDTKTPVKVAMYVIAANLTLNIILMSFFAHVGLALATSIAAYLQAVILGVILKRRGLFTLSKELLEFGAKIIVLSVAMGMIVHSLIPRVMGRLYTITCLASFEKYSSVLFILVATGVGIFFYMSTSYFTGALRLIRR
jgi:putative peptidoglycan lipid II flippase